MTSDEPDDYTVRLLHHALNRASADVNSVSSRAVSEVGRGELDEQTVAELRAAVLGLEEVLDYYDEAANPHYDEEVHR